MGARMQEYAEALFECLPADTIEDLHSRFCRKIGRRVPTYTVRRTISYVRKHYLEVQYTIPHVKRGKPAADDPRGRFFALPVERDGSFSFDPPHRQHLDEGNVATIGAVSQQMRNLVGIVQTAVQYERSPNRKEMLGELEEHYEYIAKRTARILKFMQDVA